MAINEIDYENVQGFTIFRSDWEALKEIEDPLIRLEIREKMEEYAFTGNFDLDGLNFISKMYLKSRKPTIDTTLLNFSNGKKGGRPKKEQTSKRGVTSRRTNLKKGGF